VGFEPTRAFAPHDFQSCSLSRSDTRPRCERRGRDSNPREPSGPNALAGRRLKPLGHLSHSLRQLPLLGSNQDSSDPESDVLPVTPRGSRTTNYELRTTKSGRPGSNRRPSAWEADALPTELRPHVDLHVHFTTHSRFPSMSGVSSCGAWRELSYARTSTFTYTSPLTAVSRRPSTRTLHANAPRERSTRTRPPRATSRT
jgi:hypothetical protein